MKRPRQANRRVRTRKDLLRAAATLLKRGETPTLEDVAAEALVSRATAYRYFSNIEDLIIEAPIDEAVPEAHELFSDNAELSASERVDYAESVMHRAVYSNETQLRLMLAQQVAKNDNQGVQRNVPRRQNRRTDYIECALAPFRKKIDGDAYQKLRNALALIFGTESMIVFRDVVPLSDPQARKVKSWAIRALVNAALEESKPSGRKRDR